MVRSGLFGLADKSFGHQVVSVGKNKRRRRWRVCKLHLREREMSEETRLPLGGHCLLTLCTGFTRTAARAKKLESETSVSWVVNRLECEHSLYGGVSARDCEYTHSTASWQ